MSTRCQIIVQGHNASIYRHSDGYPEGVLPDIIPFLKKFLAERGWDVEYMTARLCQHLTNKTDADLREAWKDSPEMLKRGEYFLTGYGIDGHADAKDPVFHGDEDYIYVITKTHVEVRIPTWGGFGREARLSQTKIVQRKKIPIAGRPKSTKVGEL